MTATISLLMGQQSGDRGYIACYTGEKFPLTFQCCTPDGDELDISSADITLVMTDDDGNEVIDKEAADFTSPVDGNNNQAKVTITDSDTSDKGHLTGQITADLDVQIVKSMPITLEVMTGDAALTVAEIRYALQDLDDENDYISGLEMSDGLLAMARRRAIDDWSSQPGSHTNYTTDDFPTKWREQWLKGAQGHALLMKARNLGGNAVQLNAGGMNFDDKTQRFKFYMELGRSLKGEWLAFIRRQQYNENLEKSFRTI